MGREVIDRIVARGQVEVIVLTTKSVIFSLPIQHSSQLNSKLIQQATDLELPEAVRAITVDYNDPASLASALKGVHTVLSFIAIADVQLFASVQIKLVDACVTHGVKRFAPSEWATYVVRPKIFLTPGCFLIQYIS